MIQRKSIIKVSHADPKKRYRRKKTTNNNDDIITNRSAKDQTDVLVLFLPFVNHKTQSHKCPVKYLLLTFSSNMKTSQSLVEQQSFMHASLEETSSSIKNRAPSAFDSSVRMIVDE